MCRKVVIVEMDQESCALRAHEIAKKIIVLEGNCFRRGGIIISPKDVERPADLAAELYEPRKTFAMEFSANDEKRALPLVVTMTNPMKTCPPTRQLLEALQIPRRRIQQRVASNSDNIKPTSK